jgi:hypothetical protein
VEPQRGEEQPHLPAPSLWPIGFAIGVVCILVGLIVSSPAAAVGAGITILFGFLWVRDLTRDDGESGPSRKVKGKPSDDHTNLCHKKNDVDEDDYKFYFSSGLILNEFHSNFVIYKKVENLSFYSIFFSIFVWVRN